jgi:hypothetical protein
MSSSGPSERLLVDFYDPKICGKDPRGRTLEDILRFDDRRLEHGHDYIQIIFPLPEGSPYNWEAPVITRFVFAEFRSRPELRETLRRSFLRILAFYGFDESAEDGKVKVTRRDNHLKQFRNWVTRVDHNHLRITRIIRSLRVLGLEEDAQAFYEALLAVDADFPARISKGSIMFWTRAAVRPLYLAPSEADDDAVTGPQYLKDFVEAEAEKGGKNAANETNKETDRSKAVEGPEKQ